MYIIQNCFVINNNNNNKMKCLFCNLNYFSIKLPKLKKFRRIVIIYPRVINNAFE